ncbi:hypothetical protein KSS87_021268, partial [Heliosperma pusillum]
GIPEQFMKDHGSDLSDVVSLKIPPGKTWKVELLKENGRAWFKDGWHEIVTYYSICHGHFLMFTYRGMSRFNVYVFDMTACEIEYPLDPPETKVPKTVSETPIRTNPCPPISSSKGWKKYALDNKLQLGDICVLELLNAAKGLFKAEIIRCSSRASGLEDVAGPSSPMRSPKHEIEVVLIDD